MPFSVHGTVDVALQGLPPMRRSNGVVATLAWRHPLLSVPNRWARLSALPSPSYRSSSPSSRHADWKWEHGEKNSYNSSPSYMRTVSAIDAKNRFGQLLEAAQREPVTVTKQGRPAAVVLSVEDYQRMRGAANARLLDSVRRMQKEAAAAGLTEEVLDELLTDERVDLDTNVLISAALIASSRPFAVLHHVLDAGILIFSNETFE